MSFATNIKVKACNVILSAAALVGLGACVDPKLSDKEIASLYAEGLEKPSKPLSVYFLGHSLVGRDIPYMVKQLAEDGHDYRVQLGWGTNLRSHLNPEFDIAGYEKENNHPHFERLEDALSQNNYDAFVFTEMVEIADAIKYFESVKYTTQLLDSVAQSNPRTTLYLYETWHEVNDPKGWIQRLDQDLQYYWLDRLLDKALARTKNPRAVYVIPAGQALASLFKEIDKRGGVEGINKPEDIFARTENGELDPIHINDIGAYFVALVQYATLYHASPVGKPFQLLKADGSAAIAPSEEAAALMQEIAWEVVSNYPRSGVRKK
jgi:hypothetical protein